MPQLLVTAVYEGQPVGDLVAGRPVPDVTVDVRGPDGAITSVVTDERGTAAVEVADEGECTAAVRQERADGTLQGLMTVQVAGPFALLALAVRWRPAA